MSCGVFLFMFLTTVLGLLLLPLIDKRENADVVDVKEVEMMNSVVDLMMMMMMMMIVIYSSVILLKEVSCWLMLSFDLVRFGFVMIGLERQKAT